MGPTFIFIQNKVCQKGSYNLTALLYFALQAAMIFMLAQNFYPLNMHLRPISTFFCKNKGSLLKFGRQNDNQAIANLFYI